MIIFEVVKKKEKFYVFVYSEKCKYVAAHGRPAGGAPRGRGTRARGAGLERRPRSGAGGAAAVRGDGRQQGGARESRRRTPIGRGAGRCSAARPPHQARSAPAGRLEPLERQRRRVGLSQLARPRGRAGQ